MKSNLRAVLSDSFQETRWIRVRNISECLFFFIRNYAIIKTSIVNSSKDCGEFLGLIENFVD